jgi:hypothetical protein
LGSGLLPAFFSWRLAGHPTRPLPTDDD